MKVYVSCHHPDPANELAAALRVAGHEIASGWHDADEGPRPADDDSEAWGSKAICNCLNINACDALVCIASPKHVARTKCVPGGKFVEAGIALALGRQVLTLGGVENGMLWHPDVRHAKDTTELLAMLAPASA